jgi:membrane protease YdiL (CAAX protease family)
VTNENATWLGLSNIVMFGLLFGTSYLLTGELALPIGLYFAWILCSDSYSASWPRETIRVGARPRP